MAEPSPRKRGEANLRPSPGRVHSLAPQAGRGESARHLSASCGLRSACRVRRITGKIPTATMRSAASAPSSKWPRVAELIDVGRERFDVERAQQQRRRQFLQAIDEDQQRRAAERRPQQRQLDAPRRSRRGAAPSVRAASSRLRRDARRGRRQRSRSRWRGSASRRRSRSRAAEPATTRPRRRTADRARDRVEPIVDARPAATAGRAPARCRESHSRGPRSSARSRVERAAAHARGRHGDDAEAERGKRSPPRTSRPSSEMRRGRSRRAARTSRRSTTSPSRKPNGSDEAEQRPAARRKRRERGAGPPVSAIGAASVRGGAAETA